jgi:hypothetical protein
MKLSQAIRIGALLAVIFAAGVLTGRWSKPRPRVLVMNPAGSLKTSAEALARLTERLSLDEQQQRQFAPLLEEMAGELARHLPATQERLEVFRRYYPRMLRILHAAQRSAFDRYTVDVEKRMAQMIRNRNRRTGTNNSDAGLPPPRVGPVHR